MVVDRKKKARHQLCYIWRLNRCQMLQNSSEVPTEFAAENAIKVKSERKIRNLNFSPYTKKTTEYSFERFLPIYRY